MTKSRSCFVVMGYGIKTDYSTGRKLDLDKTYKNIIKPAVEELGIVCIRADEIIHSGIIDIPMYKYLISADVVIADLSTYNTNTFYELGVRHALRPYTTIVIAEKELIKPFDVEHTIIRKYKHLGEGIDYDEVVRFRDELKSAIFEILAKPETDSPVYTYLQGLQPPVWDDSSIIGQKSNSTTLSDLIEQAEAAMAKDDFLTAIQLLNAALCLDRGSSFVIQRLTLATYKSKYPSYVESLNKALLILSQLNTEASTDPETIGLAGAIYKRLWEEGHDSEQLSKAIFYYEKGFYIKNDYYNGINLAFLLNVRGAESSGDEKVADYVLANRVRKRVVTICRDIIKYEFENRGDKYWIWASLEEAYYGLRENLLYKEAQKEAIKLKPASWARETTVDQIKKLHKLLYSSNGELLN